MLLHVLPLDISPVDIAARQGGVYWARCFALVKHNIDTDPTVSTYGTLALVGNVEVASGSDVSDELASFVSDDIKHDYTRTHDIPG